MCNGPTDTRKNIKACLELANTTFLVAMLEDWNRYSTKDSLKMKSCINEVLLKRKDAMHGH